MKTTKTLTFNQLKSIIRESIFDDSSSSSSQEARELFLYIVNDSDLYHNQILPKIANLKRKYQKGIYDSEKAVDLWMYLVDNAAKQYQRESVNFLDPEDPKPVFNKATRLDVARELRDRYEEEIKEEE